MIGETDYYHCINEYFEWKECVKKSNMEIKWNLLRLCHKCLDIKFPSGHNDFRCLSSNIHHDPMTTPFAFQKTILEADYSEIH